MHHCLQIDEILRLVVRNVQHVPTLVAMGTTCRAFYDHAMNEVWRSLLGISPLVKCLPSYTYNNEGENNTVVSA